METKWEQAVFVSITRLIDFYMVLTKVTTMIGTRGFQSTARCPMNSTAKWKPTSKPNDSKMLTFLLSRLVGLAAAALTSGAGRLGFTA